MLVTGDSSGWYWGPAGCKRLPESPQQSMPQHQQQQMHRTQQTMMMTSSTIPQAMATINLQRGGNMLSDQAGREYVPQNTQSCAHTHTRTHTHTHTHTHTVIMQSAKTNESRLSLLHYVLSRNELVWTLVTVHYYNTQLILPPIVLINPFHTQNLIPTKWGSGAVCLTS